VSNIKLEPGCRAFSLEGFEEGFSHGVVPAISFSAHNPRYSMVAAIGRKLSICLLDAAIRVEKNGSRKAAFTHCHAQCRQCGLISLERRAEAPSNDFSGPQVHFGQALD
jgi:hypothetical protein